jgi:Domain of unknown function (DUF6438)
MLKIILISMVLLITTCRNNKSQIENQTQQSTNNIKEKSGRQNRQESEQQFTLIMERFTWTHTLDYKVEIQPNGGVNFTKTDGKFINTKVTGKVESKLEKEKIEQLLTEIETSGFFSLDSAYGYSYKNCPSSVSDNESVKIYINLNGKEHTIRHDLGCFDVRYEELKNTINPKEKIFPQKLYKLENRIDEIVETGRWIGRKN